VNAPARTFTAVPAVRGGNGKSTPLLIGIMAPSGGGKTYSALRLAVGMQRIMGGDIWGVDTENNRMKNYAPPEGRKPGEGEFEFTHVPFGAPFGSLDYLEVLRYCNSRGARITIVDSMTHEHIGEGGYLETAEAVVNRIAGDDYKKREQVKMLGWAKAGPLRQKMIEGIKQLDGAFIFCFRAKEKVKPVKDKTGKTEFVDMGFMPIAGEEWVYEMTLNCMLEPRSGGIPTWRSDHIGERMMMKLPKQFEGIFADPRPLDESHGEAMARWARGDVAEKPGPAVMAVDLDTISAAARSHALAGTAALEAFWSTLNKPTQRALKPSMEAFKKLAAENEPAAAQTEDVI
jgi:hypothetical protein